MITLRYILDTLLKKKKILNLLIIIYISITIRYSYTLPLKSLLDKNFIILMIPIRYISRILKLFDNACCIESLFFLQKKLFY